MAFGPRSRYLWQLRTRSLALGERTAIMGILNVTPDSFSDGGRSLQLPSAVEHGLELLDLGADILDIGAESTRPGATPVTPGEEQARLLPVLAALRRERPDAILSVDTYHAATARAAVAAGAEIVNDVSGLLWDDEMARTLAAAAPPPGIVLMHTRGTPREWRSLPPLPQGTVEPLVRQGLRQSLDRAHAAGIPLDRVLLDPGFGFGKHGPENYALLAALSSLAALGRPILAGVSRKGFLVRHGAHGGDPSPSGPARLHATVAAGTAAILAGAHVLRVHEVQPALEAAAVADAVLAAC